MRRADCKARVILNLFDIFFKKLADLSRYKPGDQIADANGADLHKSDRMKKILTQFPKHGHNVF